MPQSLQNPHRGVGLPGLAPMPASDPAPVAALLAECPAHAETPLLTIPSLAERIGVGALCLKDERARMGLGSFKALGAAYVIARDALTFRADGPWSEALVGRRYVTASAGNHGLSVAAGAHVFGAEAVVFIARSVPESFAERLRASGARVERAGATYEDAMEAAARSVASGDAMLLSDSAWLGYTAVPHRVMEGYLQLMAEVVGRMTGPPSDVVVQAGVGGLAAAVAAHVRAVWGDAPRVVVVEPAAAPALLESIRAGRVVETRGPVSSMGRLDCKTPSLIALAGLARDADLFVTIDEGEAAAGCEALADAGYETTPSGAAGFAALYAGIEHMTPDAQVLAFLTEASAPM